MPPAPVAPPHFSIDGQVIKDGPKVIIESSKLNDDLLITVGNCITIKNCSVPGPHIFDRNENQVLKGKVVNFLYYVNRDLEYNQQGYITRVRGIILDIGNGHEAHIAINDDTAYDNETQTDFSDVTINLPEVCDEPVAAVGGARRHQRRLRRTRRGRSQRRRRYSRRR